MIIKLGQKVKDQVTGFTGIATAMVVYLNNCVQYNVQPPCGVDGKMPSGEYIDEGQLEVVNEGIHCVAQESNGSGGPSSDAPPGRYSG